MRTTLKLIAVLGAALVATGAPAEPAKKPVSLKAAYGALTKLPDWSGTWSPAASVAFEKGQKMAPPPKPDYTAEGQKIIDDFNAGKKEGKNLQTDAANCTPPGVPQIMKMPYPIEFLFTRGRVTVIAETDSQVRRIYTDGRALPDDPDPTFNGTSVGHWEGDTLVVDTIALNNKNTLVSGIRATDNTRIHERFRATRPGFIEVETTITDPKYFKTPYTTKSAYMRKDGWEMREYICEENNHDAADAFGRPSMDIK